MKLAILSTAPGCYSTRRLKEAARKRGHQVEVLDTLRFTLELKAREPGLLYDDRPVTGYDAVLPRIGTSISYFGTAVVRQFEQMGIYTPNTAESITNSRDKLRSLQILSRQDIGIPRTTFVRHAKDAGAAVRRVGGAPVIIKVLEGTQGIGVLLAETERSAQDIVETLQNLRQDVLVQRYIAESRGRDVRAIVAGNRVITAMRRIATDQEEFRSNVHRGARTESITLDAGYRRTAIRAARLMGLGLAGVDMLQSSQGPLVAEVNSSPGLQGIERATKIDVANAFIRHIEQQVNETRASAADMKPVAEASVTNGATAEQVADGTP